MDKALIRKLIERLAETIIAAEAELTELDQAIGDGDHGINMKRGAAAVLADAESLAAKPAGEAIKAAGMQLVMKVGGASGPLYGTLLMTLGKSWPEKADQKGFSEAFATAVAAVKARGKSDVQQKTMLDVLVPVSEEIAAGKSLADIRACAEASAAATVPMRAIRGRASFLGERSVGHIDPGARSSQLAVETVCNLLEEKP